MNQIAKSYSYFLLYPPQKHTRPHLEYISTAQCDYKLWFIIAW